MIQFSRMDLFTDNVMGPVVAILAVAVAVLVLWVALLEWRLRRLTRGSNGKNLEAHIASVVREYERLAHFEREVQDRLTHLDRRLTHSICGVGVVRFNPFAGSGSSKPSFAIALLSERGDGIVISTLHARDSVSIFTKHVTQFAGERELTAEETEALEKARNSLHT